MKLLFLLPALIAVSCGRPESKRTQRSSMSPVKTIEEKSNLSPEGTYVAVLQPLNGDMVGHSNGAVTVNISGDDFIANVRFNGISPNTVHGQMIHSSGFCPSEIADVNLDGYIDSSEALPYTSDVLIPLDSSLNSQAEGQGFFPLSDNWGTYIYSLKNSFSALMSDLYAPDENMSDDFGKLVPNSPLTLEDRVVVIYGVSDTVVLPESVSASSGLLPHQSLPIACGQFTKVTKIPGSPISDESPDVPVPRPGHRPTTNPAAPNRGSNDPRIPANRPQGNRIEPQSRLCRGDKTCL